MNPTVDQDTQSTEVIDDHEPRGRGCGCWVTAVTTLVVFAVLIGIGLFLPPINLYQRLTSPNFTSLTPRANAVAKDGLTLAAFNLNSGDTVDVTLNSVPMQRFLDGDASAGAWVPDALAAVPPSLALQSPVYALTAAASAGSSPQVTLSVEMPEGANPDIFDLYGWSAQTNKWQFIPAHPGDNKLLATVTKVPERVALFQAAPIDQPRVLVSYDVTQVLSSGAASVATIIAPAGLQPTLDGKLAGNLAAGFDLNAGYLVVPALRNYADPRATDPDTVAAILSNAGLRREHAAQIAAFAGSGYDGVLIDYRDLPAEQRDNFSAFITDLGTQLDPAGLLLVVAVPMARSEGGVWNTGAYDWTALGAAVDYLQVNLDPSPQIFLGDAPSIDQMTRWAVGEVSRDKLLFGMSALSQRQVGDALTAIGYDQALSALGNVAVDVDRTSAGTINPGALVQARLDGYRAVAGDTQGHPYLDYVNESGDQVARMWLTTPGALRARMDHTLPFALGGIAFDDLMSSGLANGITDAILDYKVEVPSQPSASQLALRWTIQGANGVIDQITTGLGESLVATIDAPDGNYAINVEVVGSDQSSSQRGGAALAVFAPTPTPTPLPTSTPTPLPRPTSVPVQQVANASVPSGGGQPAVAPGSGSIVGGFEYGGHVDHPATGAAGAMKHAGMSWMKIQMRYSPGTSPEVAAGPIATAHGAGFKILLGLVGYPNDLANGGDGYIQGFADWVGGVAALGPDAIEVWNEANIDREWPQGQISGANYARLLSAAYGAIKSRNGGVMVITAAPAPTGAEAAFPGRVQNDDNWLRDFVNAGGLQWADCVGAHYNEGIVSPQQTNGDPRDGYYTRYLLGMLNTYWSITGGQRPICFTELGYLTPEGYPPLDPYFGWAGNTTVAQQAAWLAQAAAILSQSGKARLMIIWNVDFSNYGTDPMAGYAMIRPGGGCPACDALAAAR